MSRVPIIGDHAFRGAAWIGAAYLTDIIDIHDEAFRDSDTDGVLSITGDASTTNIVGNFICQGSGFTSLILIDVPTVGDHAFRGSLQLEQVSFAESSIIYLGASAFQDCPLLSNVSIPSSITSIGDEVFKNCISLRYLNITGDGQMTLTGNFVLQGARVNMLLAALALALALTPSPLPSPSPSPSPLLSPTPTALC